MKVTDHRGGSIMDMELPIRVKIGFSKIFEHWEAQARSDDPATAEHAKNLLKRVDQAPILREPFDDISILEKHESEIALLLTAAFPEALAKNEIKTATLPFSPVFFNPSERFHTILNNAGEGFQLEMRDFDPEMMYRFSCIFLLNMLHGVSLEYKRPYFFDIPDQNGTMRHYRAFFNADFSSFKPNENTRQLSKEEISDLVDNFDDLELWKKKIPPNSYDFEGFGLLTLFDVTADQSLSALKNQLLESDALENEESIEAIRDKLRSWFNMHDLEVGFAAIDIGSHKIRSLSSGTHSQILGCELEDRAMTECFCEGSIHEIFDLNKTFVVSDVLRHKDVPSPLIKHLFDAGVGSFIIAPLMRNDKEPIGFLELCSPRAGAFNSVVSNKLIDIVPLFSVALQRTIDEYDTALEAIVQEEFTAIHPSVAWRFTEAADKIKKARQKGLLEEPDDLVFKDVVPVYGQFDIRGSSTARNLAIKNDLVHQMRLADKVMAKAEMERNLPIYNQLRHRIGLYRQNLEEGINAGDEVKILEFLKAEVYPVFHHLEKQSDKLKKIVSGYMQALDPTLKVVYNERKDYENTVTLINERISEFVEKQQEVAQQMFPHYFEKYKTDGVEYNAYIGQSLLQNEQYDPIYLSNLRLWQLLLTCSVENMVHQLRDEMPAPLEIASLILAHSSPLAIKFRMDEKQFDVDGAYNIRYEIVKKRIDKAYIKGTNERLTQPGKIAIVYSHDNEAGEYKRYLEYLQSIKAIGPVIEEVELEDLQGTAGLRALRVDIVFEQTAFEQAMESLQAVEVAR